MKRALKSVLLAASSLLACSCLTTAFGQPDSVVVFAQHTESTLIAEERLGKLAEDQGTSRVVKNYGALIAKQDAAMESSLKRAAQTVHVVLPTAVDSDEQHFYDRVSKLTGAAFDRAYADNAVQVAESQVDAFRRIAELGPFAAIDMAPIKTFATNNLLVVEAQLQQARQMAETVDVNQSKSNSAAPAN
jgi:putative membrane protein